MPGQLRSSQVLVTAFAFTLLSSALPAQQSVIAAPAAGQETTAEKPATTTASRPAAEVATAADDPMVSDAVSVSQVRIVRLSEIRGEAELDRNTGRGFGQAFANIPITRGARLRTHGGLAEVEFEDNSTLRLTPDSSVVFGELGRKADGGTVSAVQVLAGTVYVSLQKTRANEFSLSFGKTSLQLTPGTHLRLEAQPSSLQVAVLDGSVDFNGPGGSMTLPKKRTLSINFDATPQPTLLSAVSKGPYDGWDKQEADYQKRYANGTATGGSGLLFGSSDLNYYGSFTDLPGCGSVWRPYFTSAAWDPYGSGVWAWYSGAGYSWVSPYPWGWLPFHSGSWTSCGAGGWGWRPGGGWVGLQNGVAGGVGLRAPRMPPRPPHPPAPGRPTLLLSNTHPLQASQLTAPDTFTFRKDSAGFGVPRETFGRLGKTSASVERHGFVHAEAETALIGAHTEAAQSSRATSHGENQAAHSWAASRPVAVISRPSYGGGGNGSNAAAWGTVAHSGTNGNGTVSTTGTRSSPNTGWSHSAPSASTAASSGSATRSSGASAGGWSGGGAASGAGRSTAPAAAAPK